MNSTSNVSMFALDTEFLVGTSSLLLSMRYELMLFAAALAAHFLLFGNANPRGTQRRKTTKERDTRQPAMSREQEKVQDASSTWEAFSGLSSALSTSRGQLDELIQAASRAGDHRKVLHYWTAAKKASEVPVVPLDKVVESMQRYKKDQPFIIKELQAFFRRRDSSNDGLCMDLVNDLLASLGKHLESALMEQIIEMLPSVGLVPDQRTYDALLSVHFMSRNFSEVQHVAAEMKAKRVPFNTRTLLVVIKTALKTNRLDEATAYFRELKATWGPDGATSGSPSTAPRHIVLQVLELACREGRLAELLPELERVPLTEQVVQMMLAECLKQSDMGLLKRVEALARDRSVQFSEQSFTLLVKASWRDTAHVEELFEEAVSKNIEFSSDLVHAVLAVCGQHGNLSLANRLFKHARPKQPSVLAAFVRLYVDAEDYDSACNAYDEACGGLGTQRLLLDARTERSLMNAALRCGRSHLAQSILDTAPSDLAKHVTMIRNCAAESNLSGAMSIFDSLKQRGIPLNSIIYNSVLDACVECHELKRAEAWMEEMKEVGMADVVSYNTLIKAHLHHEAFDKARTLMEEMRIAGFQPNRVTFNELVNAMVSKGCPIWGVLDEMNAAGVQPNQVTCSILLKNLRHDSEESDILKTMEMINAMEEPMDEVLLSSVVEACVRIGKPDLLSSKLKQLRGGEGVAITGSHTFGSLIKAYGRAGDISGVWQCWKEMRSRHVKPTSVTLGCMVEAVVSNGDADGAYDLVHQMREDEHCRGALNAVIYCSVLKGFAREKRLERVWAVYAEMQEQGMESIVTYNTIIDACTRCNRMDQVPDVLESMRRANTVPNIITYSTILKGHCQSGNIQEGFAILQRMRQETSLKPDEVMYNSMLDGCAQQGLVDEGMRLLDEMQAENVRPSNFTLSVLVKLFSRARKVDKAFSLVRELSAKYRIKPNVHVYTNLIQACVSNRQVSKGMGCLEQMVEDGVQPNERTYSILLRACLSAGIYDSVAALLRAALGLESAPPALRGSAAACNLDSSLISQTITGLSDGCRAPQLAADLMVELRKCRPGLRLGASGNKGVGGYGGYSGPPPMRPPRAGKGCGRSRA